jgi:lipoprotein-releasing system ATP-binding protein
LLKYMGLWEHRNSKPGELSGGECQRTAVARALINQPQILLADEPTGSLDEYNAGLLMDLLVRINSEMKITIVIATHSMDIARRMDKVYTIRNGKLVQAD